MAKGFFLRLTDENEKRLSDLIEFFSNDVVTAEKTAIVNKAIEEMHKNYVEIKGEDNL